MQKSWALSRESLQAFRLAGVVAVLVAACSGSVSSPGPTTTPPDSPSTLGSPTTPSLTATASPTAIKTAVAQPTGDVTVDGAAPGTPWKAISWTTSQGLGAIDDIFRWNGGWITQVHQTDYKEPATFYVSSDGASWHRIVSNLPTAKLAAVSAGRLLAVDFNGVESELWASADAISWQRLSVSGLKPTQVAVASSPTALVAAELNPSGSAVYWSPDGKSWQPSAGLDGLVESRLIVFAQGRFLLFGDKAHSGGVWWSLDGRTWKESSAPSGVGFWGGGGGGGWANVYVGTNGLIGEAWGAPHILGAAWYRSTDGLSWEGMGDFAPVGLMDTTSDPPPQCPNGFLASDGQRILAYGWDGAARISTDGASWSRLAMDRLPIFDQWKAKSADCQAAPIQVRVMPRGLLVIGDGSQYGEAR